MPTPRKVNRNSKGKGGLRAQLLKESMAQKWSFQRGWGFKLKKPSVGGVCRYFLEQHNPSRGYSVL